MVISRGNMNLSKILWIKEEYAESLSKINKDDADFFYKNSNNNILQLKNRL